MMKSLPVADNVEMSVRKCCLRVSDCLSLMSFAPTWTMMVVVCGRSAMSLGRRELISSTFAPEYEIVSALGMRT